MKTQITITKKTLATIITQARSLGAFHRPKGSLSRVIRCEVEQSGKRSFIELPERLCDWLKDFDSPPLMEITVGKRVIEQLVKPVGKEARIVRTVLTGYIAKASASEGGRVSRLSCAISRLKTPPLASVFLRIDAQGVVSCVERVAKLARVECAHGKRFIRAMVLSESHGGKWLLTKKTGMRFAWIVLFQPCGMVGACVVNSDLCCDGSEANAIKSAIEWIVKYADRVRADVFDNACELAEQAEREAREATGEEVGEIVRAKRPEVEPLAPAPSPVVESVAVVEAAPIPPAMESTATPSGGISEENKPFTYLAGDKAHYTGHSQTLNGALFYTVLMAEGRVIENERRMGRKATSPRDVRP